MMYVTTKYNQYLIYFKKSNEITVYIIALCLDMSYN